MPRGPTRRDARDPGARDRVAALYRARPRRRLARASALALAGLAGWAWSGGFFSLADLTAPRSRANLERFLGELVPYPLRTGAADPGAAFGWAREVFAGRAAVATADTLALAACAIALAGALALLASPLAARILMRAEPLLPAARRAGVPARVAFALVATAVRGGLIALRAVPEYLWAVLLLSLLGPGAWPAVLALALHNAGILGRLFSDVMEDADPRPARALRGLGATRLQLAWAALWPLSAGRFLLVLFYRWETCVREATILGLLGFGGIGAHILQAQAARRWDELLAWTALGAMLILVGDAVSARARRAMH